MAGPRGPRETRQRGAAAGNQRSVACAPSSPDAGRTTLRDGRNLGRFSSPGCGPRHLPPALTCWRRDVRLTYMGGAHCPGSLADTILLHFLNPDSGATLSACPRTQAQSGRLFRVVALAASGPGRPPVAAACGPTRITGSSPYFVRPPSSYRNSYRIWVRTTAGPAT